MMECLAEASLLSPVYLSVVPTAFPPTDHLQEAGNCMCLPCPAVHM